MSLNDTIDALYNSGIGGAVERGFQTVSRGSKGNAPISANLLTSNSSKIIIDKSLIPKVQKIQETIQRQKSERGGRDTLVELPFAMLGHKDKDGNTIITDIVYDMQDFERRLEFAEDHLDQRSIASAVAEFDGIANTMNNHALRRDIEKPVLIHCHTHPRNIDSRSNITSNFSLADMDGYRTYAEALHAHNPNVEVLGMVVNELGDFNVTGYNLENGIFEKHDNVNLEGIGQLPSYSEAGCLVSSNESTNQNANISMPNVSSQNSNSNFESRVGVQRITRAEIETLIPDYYQNTQPVKPNRSSKNRGNEKQKHPLIGALTGKLKKILMAVDQKLSPEIYLPESHAMTSSSNNLARGASLNSVDIHLPESHAMSNFNVKNRNLKPANSNFLGLESMKNEQNNQERQFY